MGGLRDRLRAKLDSRKTPYPNGTKRKYLTGGLVAVGIPLTAIVIGFSNGAYDGPGGWIYMFVTPWHLVTLIGMYYVCMSFLIKEKGKRK